MLPAIIILFIVKKPTQKVSHMIESDRAKTHTQGLYLPPHTLDLLLSPSARNGVQTPCLNSFNHLTSLYKLNFINSASISQKAIVRNSHLN